MLSEIPRHIPTPEDIAATLGNHAFRYVDLEDPAEVIPFPDPPTEPEDLIA